MTGFPDAPYDRGAVRAGVVHLGVGAFHRAHQGVFHEALLAAGHAEWGICGVGVLERDRPTIEALRAQDGRYTVVVKRPDGTVEPQVVGALVELLLAPDDPEAVVERLAAPEIRAVTMTITEGGYGIDDGTGAFDPATPGVAADLAGDRPPATVFGLVTEALRRRRERGTPPLTVISCDNLQGNGHVARTAFGTFARLRSPELGDWVEREVAFPSSVVDRITPATTALDRRALLDLHGIDDRVPVVCEPFLQWVLEDTPVRPPYEAAGVRIVDDARPHELMKLRLLNAGHQAVAYVGRLRGHTYVHEAAQDPAVAAFLDAFLDLEARPTLTGVAESEVAGFRAAIGPRFGNAAISDTLVRLATDASDRIPKFVLPVARERLAAGGDARRSAAIVAAWAHVLVHAGEDITDRRRDALVTRARAGGDAFVGDPAIFGDLAGDARFAADVRDARSVLDAGGVDALLAALS